jgi:hypothetical protein
MGKNSKDKTPESSETTDSSATAETPVAASEAATPAPPENPPTAQAASSGASKGVVAAIAGSAAVVALLLGLLIGWFAFDVDDGHGGRGDKDRMEQKQQGPGMGNQRGGGQKGGMVPGDEMMPGQGRGQMRPDNAVPIEPTAPTTQGSVVPQSLQQS